MAEYIERSAGVSILRAKANMAVLMDAATYFEKAAQMLEKLPAADVAPVRHGKWLNHTMIDGHIHAECSECHKVRIIDNYCPNCGCLMCCDYCPVSDVPGVCRFEERGDPQ